MFKFFIDNDCEENLMGGLPYFAAGLIETDYTKDGVGVLSGKDFSVVFIDPWGCVQREWRSINEIRIIDVEEDRFNYLQESIKKLDS